MKSKEDTITRICLIPTALALASCQWGVNQIADEEDGVTDTIEETDRDAMDGPSPDPDVYDPVDRVDQPDQPDVADQVDGESCAGNEDCDDGEPCNGEETCGDGDVCVGGDPLPEGSDCETAGGEDGTCRDEECTLASCGNGEVDGGEECDDGRNHDPDDGCTDACQYSCREETQDDDCDDGHGCTQNICISDSHTCDNPLVTAEDFECRPSAGDCDPAENCNGADQDCPADALAGEGEECRASTGPCDPAETCDGESAACPADEGVAAGTPCDDDDPCSMLDVCDSEGGCSGTESCDGSPITGTGDDTRIGICVTDASCDSETGGPGCSSAHPVELKSSWATWDTGTETAMALCAGYWAYTSPPLESGTETCYAFYHAQSGSWFYADQGSPADCGPDHCGRDACAYTP